MKRLAAVWPTMRDAGETQHLVSAWLLYQPDEHQIGIVTVAAKVAGTDEEDRRHGHLPRSSTANHSPDTYRRNWLLTKSSTAPASTCPGGCPGPTDGAPSAFPTFPVHPLPCIVRGE